MNKLFSWRGVFLFLLKKKLRFINVLKFKYTILVGFKKKKAKFKTQQLYKAPKKKKKTFSEKQIQRIK